MVLLCVMFFVFFVFKLKTAYELRISDWSSDVCSSDLIRAFPYGETRTVKDLRLDLADERGVAAVCAVTTCRHLRRIAKAVSESIAAGAAMDDAVPVWRVVDESSPLLHRSSSPAKPLASRRRSETSTGVR